MTIFDFVNLFWTSLRYYLSFFHAITFKGKEAAAILGYIKNFICDS